MNKRLVRAIAAVAVLATAGLSLELVPGSVSLAGAASGSTTINVGCAGATDDVAGTVGGANKTSAGLVALLATLGGPPSLSLPVTVDATLPDKVKKGSGNFDASFKYTISVPPALATQAKTALQKSSLDIVNASFNVTYDGVESGTLPTATIASQTIDLNNPAAGASVTIAGPVPSDASGHLTFRPGVFNVGIAVNASVAGAATVGTLTLICGSSSPIGGTSIQVPGAPNTPGTITAGGIIGGDTSLIPIKGRTDISDDDGNPIQWDTLKVVNGPYGAKVANGFLAQPTPAAGGIITSTLELCAPSRPVPEVPGTDQVQTIKWPTPMYPSSSGSHPLYMTLKFGGQETAPIATSNDFQFNPYTGLGLLGQFIAPSTTAIANALGALPSVGKGNVKVTAVAGGYNVEWVGAKANTALPMIELGQWVTTPFAFSGYGAIQAAIATLSAPAAPADPNAPPDPKAYAGTVDQLNADLVAGRVTPDQYTAKFGSALGNSIKNGINIDTALAAVKQIFPQPPDLTGLKTQGVPTIPATTTGPLCSQFDVAVPSVSIAFFQALDRFFRFLDGLLKPKVLGCTLTKVKVRVKSHGRYVTKTVTKKVCTKAKKR